MKIHMWELVNRLRRWSNRSVVMRIVSHVVWMLGWFTVGIIVARIWNN